MGRRGINPKSRDSHSWESTCTQPFLDEPARAEKPRRQFYAGREEEMPLYQYLEGAPIIYSKELATVVPSSSQLIDAET